MRPAEADGFHVLIHQHSTDAIGLSTHFRPPKPAPLKVFRSAMSHAGGVMQRQGDGTLLDTPGPGNTDEADRAFARYCTSGDPGDLAQTFEATAPELLRVARHLTPDAATAEDVLQATFLAAIESRGRFEQDQRVRPWLCGILEHKAKEIARRERRVIDTDRLPEQLSSTPIDAAEHSELHGAIDDAMSELGETYRAVLHPYLTAGKSARAIAESLRRPAGTVRTQIVRGLEKLRQTLPVGLAGALTAWVLPERGLAAVQQAVTHHAQTVAASTTVAATVAAAAAGGGATATKTTVATTGGILLMKEAPLPCLSRASVLRDVLAAHATRRSATRNRHRCGRRRPRNRGV